MKKAIPFSVIILFAANCFGQDTVVKKNWLTETVQEVYHVLKPDKVIKQGMYQALFNRKTALASGMYTNNKRTGTWHFYDTRGQLIQNFDFDKNRLLYEEPVDDYSHRYVSYAFDTTFKAADRVTKPIKIGGRCYGFIPYLKLYQLSDDLSDIDSRYFSCVLEVLVSPGGRLADIKIHISTSDFSRTITFSPELIDEEDREFVPATFNGEPIMSRIFVKCFVSFDGSLDVGLPQ